jgi:predicted dithiol-disulfide oxidoreductase (DUF899 family)
MRYTNLNGESDAYVAAREELRRAEAALIAQQERVATMRRGLPPGPALPDYTFLEGPSDLSAGDEPTREVLLTELVSDTGRALIVYHLMFGKQQTDPCPMCTMWVDGFNAVFPHVEQNADLVIVAAADLGPLRDHARARGWSRLRLLSAASSSFKLDLGSEDAAGSQFPEVSVFNRDGDGTVRHFYSGSPRLADDVNERGIDPLCATWQLLDLTPSGRGAWYASLSYP